MEFPKHLTAIKNRPGSDVDVVNLRSVFTQIGQIKNKKHLTLKLIFLLTIDKDSKFKLLKICQDSVLLRN